MPAQRDDELAVIFREMRRASERSLESLAGQLNTAPATLEALESGEIAALPEWGETSRVVTAYTALLHLDGRPVLRRLEKRFSASRTAREAPPAAPAKPAPAQADMKPANPAPAAPAAAPSPQPAPPKAIKGPPLPPGAGTRPAAPVPAVQKADAPNVGTAKAEARDPKPSPASAPAPAAEKPVTKPQEEEAADITASLTEPAPEEQKPAKSRRGRKGAIITWVLLLGVFGVMGLGVRHAIQHPAAVWSTVDSLPEPVPQTVRSVWELVRPLEGSPQPAPAMDPQSQKTDRLPGTEAPQGN